MEDIWKQLEKKDELSRCQVCGKKIWKYWHIDSNLIKGEMIICAPCLFNKKNKAN